MHFTKVFSIVPKIKLLARSTSTSDNASQSSFGIGQVNRLWLKQRSVSLEQFPISGGIVPENELFDMSNEVKAGPDSDPSF